MNTRICCGAIVLAMLASGSGCQTGTGGGGGGGDRFVDPADAVAQTTPADGATGTSIDAALTITLAKAADPDSLDAWLEPDTDVDWAWSAGNTVLTGTPAEALDPGTQYAAHIGELNFVDGTELADEFSFSFTTAGDTAEVGAPLPLNEVRFWGYQIQAIDQTGAVDALAKSRYDMLVIEPTRTDAELLDFDTKGMVDRLKHTPANDGVHRKLVIAYVDIGEAEDWRWYWTWSKESQAEQIPEKVDLPEDWPAYIVARDPDGWAGNYPVAYWNTEWKDVMIYGENREPEGARNFTSAIDELILDGFDGIYLDWVEGFENEHVIAAAQADGTDAAGEMVKFITELRNYARELNPGFVVIQQNATALLDDYPELLDEIDGIAQEGIWYDGSASDDWDELTGYSKTEAQLTGEYTGFLDQFLAAGIPVFACEYSLADNADAAYAAAAAKGYVGYVTRRSLSRLTDTAPPGY